MQQVSQSFIGVMQGNALETVLSLYGEDGGVNNNSPNDSKQRCHSQQCNSVLATEKLQGLSIASEYVI